MLVKVYYVTLKRRVPRKIFTLTPTLSQGERASGSLSLWERVGVRAKFDEGTRFQCYKISLNKDNFIVSNIGVK